MNRIVPSSAAGVVAEQQPAKPDELPNASPPHSAVKRQLKDYPQSLQTAARALWG
jgi:hypothetical protein